MMKKPFHFFPTAYNWRKWLLCQIWAVFINFTYLISSSLIRYGGIGLTPLDHFFWSEALKSAGTLSIVCSFWFVYDYCCFEECLILFNALNMLSLDNCTFCYLHIGLKLFLAVVHFLFDVRIFPPLNLHAFVNLIDVQWCCVICYNDKCNVMSRPYETYLGIEAEFSQ